MLSIDRPRKHAKNILCDNNFISPVAKGLDKISHKMTNTPTGLSSNRIYNGDFIGFSVLVEEFKETVDTV